MFHVKMKSFCGKAIMVVGGGGHMLAVQNTIPVHTSFLKRDAAHASAVLKDAIMRTLDFC